MSREWVGRIARPPMEDVVKSALGIQTEGYTHQLYFRYPLHGGFEALVQAMIQDPEKVLCNTAVKSVRKDRGGWQVFDGEKARTYDHLVMAFPVTEAVKCFE